MAQAVSGLAASIRAANESETFDLAGHSQANITTTINDAFKDPFPISDMIRITFITGAGKLGRQRYDEGAAKALTSALRALDYEEDRAASCVVECAGTFKMQHDTGKNLKTVVVFPNISGGDTDGVEGGVAEISLGDEAAPSSLLPAGTPEYMVAMSSTNVFERMWQSKCPSWAQKKGCLAALGSVKKMVQELDSTLLSGTPLSEAEQDLYDSISVSDLEAKEALVKKEMHNQVETGNITKLERTLLLEQVTEKIQVLTDEIAEAEKAKKPKKAEKLKAMKVKASARKNMLESIDPKPPHKLRHEVEIAKLWAEMRPLQQLEDSAKGRLLSVKETTALSRKDEILEQIEQLEEASRGWFEEDDAFADRIKASRAARAKDKKKVTKKSGGNLGTGSGYKTKPTSSWVTPGASKKKATSKPAKNKASGGGGVFAAMMMDSDSD